MIPFLAQTLPTLPPETPWMVVVAVAVLIMLLPLIQRIIDKRLEQQATDLELRQLKFKQQLDTEREKSHVQLEQEKAKLTSAVRDDENIKALIHALSEFTGLLSQRDKIEQDEKIELRKALTENTKNVGGLGIAIESMNLTLSTLKAAIDRLPLDVRIVLTDVIDETVRSIEKTKAAAITTNNPGKLDTGTVAAIKATAEQKIVSSPE